MNRSAQQHLTKAKDYAAKGEQFYRKAAEEIIAAKESDPNLTNALVAKDMGRDESWVSALVRWGRDEDPSPTPFAGPRGDKREAATAAKVLREASPEKVAELIREADVERGHEISMALNKASLERQREKEQRSAEKAREVLGDETVEGLEFTEAVQETGWYLIKANQDLAGFLKRANELGIENVPDRFRESWLDSAEGAEEKLGMARALIQADDIDWTAFEDMLGKEVN